MINVALMHKVAMKSVCLLNIVAIKNVVYRFFCIFARSPFLDERIP